MSTLAEMRGIAAVMRPEDQNGVHRDQIVAWADEIQRLEASNAALLAACEAMIADLDSGFGSSVTHTNDLKAAIALAKSDQKASTT